jgi:hypothetical protein
VHLGAVGRCAPEEVRRRCHPRLHRVGSVAFHARRTR